MIQIVDDLAEERRRSIVSTGGALTLRQLAILSFDSPVPIWLNVVMIWLGVVSR